MSNDLRGFIAVFFSASLMLLPFVLPFEAWCWALYGVAVFVHLQWAGHIYRWAQGGAQ